MAGAAASLPVQYLGGEEACAAVQRNDRFAWRFACTPDWMTATGIDRSLSPACACCLCYLPQRIDRVKRPDVGRVLSHVRPRACKSTRIVEVKRT